MQTGIFSSWEECKAQTDGHPGSEFKSFKTKKEAEEYLGIKDTGVSDIPICNKNEAVAYVDGSFDAKTSRYAYGCIIITDTQERIMLNGVGDNKEAALSRNVAGELLGTMKAIQWACNKGIKHIIIYHDYSGISKWYNREWKAESFVAKEYIIFAAKYGKSIKVSFNKVEAHTGNTLNEEADKLAKKALGLIK